MKAFPVFKKQDVEVKKLSSLYQGFFKLIKYQFKHKLFAGGFSPIITREVLERGHAVAVLLFDPVLDEMVFIEQFRIGALATSDSPWLLEIVAGMIDDDESPEQVCRREAVEEAGVEIKQLYKALSYLSSPGGTTERIHIFVGEVDATQAKGIHGLDHEDEDILVRRVSVPIAKQWLVEGKLDNAATLIAVQWFLLNKQMVLDEWTRN